jgi:CheY-like chemotaxis protein
MQLLVIEDDDALLEIIADELRLMGHDVRVARDGLEGWQSLNDDAPLPDVILLDLMMPNLDGHQFRIRQLADPHLARIPTLVHTVLIIDPKCRRALGDVFVVPKSAGLLALLAAIAEAVEPRGRVVKRCDCGRVYDSGAWSALRKVGDIDNGREVGERLELRNCECLSTLAWEVGVHAISIPPPKP